MNPIIADIFLPVAAMEVNAIVIISIGIFVGIISGFFGVGGGIIAVPFLFVFLEIPFHIAIGSSLAFLIGTCISGAYRHHRLENVRYRIGTVFMIGSFIGVELGANMVEIIKNTGSFEIKGRFLTASDVIISFIYIIMLISVSILMYFESKSKPRGSRDLKDSVAMESIYVKKLNNLFPPPYIKFRESDRIISIWLVISISIVVGFITGLLGVGGGFLLVPAMVYLLNLRTKTAIGTSLFSIILSSIFGTFSHTIKGNVDIVLVIILLLGSTIGAQFGAAATRKFRGPQIRFYFSILTFIAAVMSSIKLFFILFGR